MNEINKEYRIGTGLPSLYKPVILIDCMDTILYRDMSLEALLSIWAKKMGKEFGVFPRFLNNYRQEVVASAMHNTVPISVIYGEIYDHCNHFGLIHSCNKMDFINRAHEIELKIELKYQHLISETAQFLNKAKEEGVKIYCVSDFRLSGSDLIEFFKNLGVDHLFSGVYSSCDVGKTKKDGSLYKYVLDCIHKDASECMMIGDNYKSDCVNACKNGIDSYQVQKMKLSIGSELRDLWYRFS